MQILVGVSIWEFGPFSPHFSCCITFSWFLLSDDQTLRGFGVCHWGSTAEAGHNKCYSKFGPVQSRPTSGSFFWIGCWTGASPGRCPGPGMPGRPCEYDAPPRLSQDGLSDDFARIFREKRGIDQTNQVLTSQRCM